MAAGQTTAGLAATAINLNGATIADDAGNAANLSLSGVTQSGPQIDTTAPVISSIVESPSSGDLNAGKTVTLTIALSENVTVNTAGGKPTLALNDGATATYVSGSGNTLTFSYTAAAGQTIVGLAATAINLNGATIADGAGNAANLSLSGVTQSGPQIDTTAPVISSVVESPSSGDLNAGKTVTLTIALSENVTVNTAGGTPTLTLNDGATATYVSGTGNTLTFSYTAAAGQTTAGLAATTINLNGATIADGAGNAANLSLSGVTQSGPQIDTTTPVISSVVESPSSGDLNAGKTVTLTIALSENVTVNTTGGKPTLTLNDGATATYVSGSGNTLTFSYTAAAGQTTAGLAATAINLNGATIADGAGNAANLSLSGLTQTGPQIDTTAPVISSSVESPSSSDLNVGKTVTLTIALSEYVKGNNAGGTPTLTLNDGATATNVSGTGNTLTFSYTAAAGQTTAGLAATTINLNGATIADGAGNAANLSLSGVTQSGPQIDTTAPVISSVVESPSSGDLNAGKTVTLTIALSENVTVNTTGGKPTLTLNDGATATYLSGSGNTLTFSYTVAAGQTSAGLAATAINLNGATIADGAGNAANLSLSGVTQSGPQIDTTAPVISSIVESPSSGDLNAGKTVTLTLALSENVTVNTAGGTPTLTLNDGATATYVSGTGNTLTFSYTAAAGQSTAGLAATTINLNGATIADGAGNAANLSLSGVTQSGPQIDTSAPAAPVIARDTTNRNRTVTLTGTAEAGSKVTVYEGQTDLGTTTTSASGTWAYTTGRLPSGNHTFDATATDAAGNTSGLSNPIDPLIASNPYDITGQGYGDIVVQSGPFATISYANMAGGVFSGWDKIKNTPGWTVAGVGDVNGNGSADIVIENAGQIEYANMAGGVFSGWVSVGNRPGYNVVGVGDINGDGYADVVVQNASGAIAYANMAGGVFSGWVNIKNTPGWTVAAVADVNGDGFADVVIENAGQIEYANMARGVFSGWVSVGDRPGYNVVGVGNISGDGAADVVVQSASGQIAYADMAGGVFSGWVNIKNTPGWTVTAVEDVNGDGFADVVIENAAGQIEYANMAGGVFSGWVTVGTVGSAPGGVANVSQLSSASTNPIEIAAQPGKAPTSAIDPITPPTSAPITLTAAGSPSNNVAPPASDPAPTSGNMLQIASFAPPASDPAPTSGILLQHASFAPPAVDPAATAGDMLQGASFAPPASDPAPTGGNMLQNASFAPPASGPAGAGGDMLQGASFAPPASDPPGTGGDMLQGAGFAPPASDPAPTGGNMLQNGSFAPPASDPAGTDGNMLQGASFAPPASDPAGSGGDMLQGASFAPPVSDPAGTGGDMLQGASFAPPASDPAGTGGDMLQGASFAPPVSDPAGTGGDMLQGASFAPPVSDPAGTGGDMLQGASFAPPASVPAATGGDMLQNGSSSNSASVPGIAFGNYLSSLLASEMTTPMPTVNNASGPQSTLGHLPNGNEGGDTLSTTKSNNNGSVALLVNYMASSFAATTNSSAGAMVVAGGSNFGNESMLAMPQHA